MGKPSVLLLTIPYYYLQNYNGELKDLWEALWLLDRGEYGFTWPLLPLRVGSTCATNFYSLYVSYEGDVRPCSGTFVPLGNIREAPLARTWDRVALASSPGPSARRQSCGSISRASLISGAPAVYCQPQPAV